MKISTKTIKGIVLIPMMVLFLNITKSSAQVYFHESFESGIAAGFVIADVDALTVAASISTLFPNANTSIGVNFAHGSSDKSVISTSWYEPAGVANDWIITDTIIIP